MKFVSNKRPLPRCFRRHPHAKGLVAEADITPLRYGRLSAKLLIFDTQVSLRRFWRKLHAGGEIGKDCLGVVNALAQTRQKVGKTSDEDDPAYLAGDPRYFCLIGLCKPHLTTEIIMHEAVHAGFCYEKRVRRNLFGKVAEFDEERIAYPAGMIGAAINCFLHKRKLYSE